MGDKFRLVIDDRTEPAVNMARDKALPRRFITGKSSPCVRFYHWKPPGLSLGRFQSIEKGVDMARGKEHGVDIVRRLTVGKGPSMAMSPYTRS